MSSEAVGKDKMMPLYRYRTRLGVYAINKKGSRQTLSITWENVAK
jgi:hypothetical protein